MLNRLRESNPDYNKSITFVFIDWDTFSNSEVTTSRRIPRRSTIVLIKDGKEAGRLVAQTSEEVIKDLLEKGSR